MNVYEAIGVGYNILATTIFTAQLAYFCAKGLGNMRRPIERGQTEETQDLERAGSIRRQMAKVS